MTKEQAIKFCNRLAPMSSTHEGVIGALRAAYQAAYDLEYCVVCNLYSAEKHPCVPKKKSALRKFFWG